MSQCTRVLAVLADGHPHTIQEIHDRAGTMRLNSRVAELRTRGHEIVCTREGDTYSYRLVASLDGSSPEEAVEGATASGLPHDDARAESRSSLGPSSEVDISSSLSGSAQSASLDSSEGSHAADSSVQLSLEVAA